MDLLKAARRLPGADQIVDAATSGYDAVGKPILTSTAGRAVTKYATTCLDGALEKVAKGCGIPYTGKKHALTEDNLRKLDLENDTLEFSSNDLLNHPFPSSTTRTRHNPNALEFTDDDLLDLSDLDSDADSQKNWSVVCAPGSKQMSEWEGEEEGEEDDDDATTEDKNANGEDRLNEENMESKRQGGLVEQVEEVWGIAKSFVKAIPLR
ncbi:hypothetical protein BU26DRAFT_500691 [Trematosphaeria pertusa]|uniref:Uncharacterized protein n=1 Tax=Trematosphaeria pertusa TaxID=390896 RepID=A0A6A6IXG3_9PLEO|nr:uncharacterized protein BU26DRAFT_500691 [Trematosphaeria pertusa]KAF2255056.1 hypothetical protein BU26DRAFT_500691 [Trematosphaeria pertusa]